jgi:hypothetical protein
MGVIDNEGKIMHVEAYAYQRVTVTLPYSEVLMHLRLAGKERKVDVLPDGVQLLDEDNEPLSFPVTHGEAGIRYLGMPELLAHKDCILQLNNDCTWHCYTHEIYGVKE